MQTALKERVQILRLVVDGIRANLHVASVLLVIGVAALIGWVVVELYATVVTVD